MAPELSLIVPTRGRASQLRSFLESLAKTACSLDGVEVVLSVDGDDAETLSVTHPRLRLKKIPGPAGRTMGRLNQAGAEAASGRFLMLLNDDVIARTDGWDRRILDAFRTAPDDIALVHVNDTLFRENLCTFPAVSRTYVDLAGGIIPEVYRRYRIDDHIEDVFNLLRLLGDNRVTYLPDVVFEHRNDDATSHGLRDYQADPAILALDAPTFDRLRSHRTALALRLKEHIEEHARRRWRSSALRTLDAAPSAEALRKARRQHVASMNWQHEPLPRVSVAVLADPYRSARTRRCVNALRKHTSNLDLILSETVAPNEAQRWNRLLYAADSEYVVFLPGDAIVDEGWLQKMLARLAPDVACVTASYRRSGDDAEWGGVVFTPDGSGHHGPIRLDRNKPARVERVLGPIDDAFLVDRRKLAGLDFDPSQGQWFMGLDFGLRLWEAGQGVAATTSAVLTRTTHAPLPHGDRVDERAFDVDRRLFVERWIHSRKLEAIRVPQPALQIAQQLERLAADAVAEDHPTAIPAELRSAPILWHFAAGLHDASVGPSSRPWRRLSRALAKKLDNAAACWRELGPAGFARVVAKKLGVGQARDQRETQADSHDLKAGRNLTFESRPGW